MDKLKHCNSNPVTLIRSFTQTCFNIYKPWSFASYTVALGHLNSNKKLSYRRGTARCVVSIEILPIATQQCRNYLYDKS